MNLKAFNLEEINYQESKQIDGGAAPVIAVAAAIGVGLGIIIVGDAVGYGIYLLVDWATS